MSDTQQPQYAKEPRAKLGGLYEKQSAKGVRYFVGYFGGFKLLVMPEKNPEPGKPEWAVFAVERAQQEQPPAQGQQGRYATPSAQNGSQQQGYQHGRQPAYQGNGRAQTAPPAQAAGQYQRHAQQRPDYGDDADLPF